MANERIRLREWGGSTVGEVRKLWTNEGQDDVHRFLLYVNHPNTR